MQGRRAIIVVGAGAAILVLILIFFLVLPKMGQVTEAEKELEETIRRIDQQVPPTADLSAVILFLRNAASVAGVQVISLTPAPPVADPSGGFSTISVSASGECSYFAMVKYLHEIETLPRAATVEAVNLSPTEGSTLSFTATITFYTSDLSAGPGSEPGPTETVAVPGG